jgi:hypothetical protein
VFLLLSKIGKAAELHLILALFWGWCCAELRMQIIEYSCIYVLIGFSYSTPHKE